MESFADLDREIAAGASIDLTGGGLRSGTARYHRLRLLVEVPLVAHQTEYTRSPLRAQDSYARLTENLVSLKRHGTETEPDSTTPAVMFRAI